MFRKFSVFSGKIDGYSGFLIALVIYFIGILRNVELPGLYMDAINPDYLAALWLNPGISNPTWQIPYEGIPILGGLYHGMQTAYLGLLTYGTLGTSVTSARITHALFGAVIILITWLIFKRLSNKDSLALIIVLALATDMSFLGSFRTQSYIILSGQGWILLSFYLLQQANHYKELCKWPVVTSGIAAGLSVYGYFVFLFFIPPLVAYTAFGKGYGCKSKWIFLWGSGFFIGLLPYLIGYLELIFALGGIKQFMLWMQNAVHGLKPLEGSSTYKDGFQDVLRFASLALSGIGNEKLIFGIPISSQFITLRSALFIVSTAICTLGAFIELKRNKYNAYFLITLVALPISFLLISAWFGSRLGVHHFTVFVALAYLMIGAAVWWLSTIATKYRIVVSNVASVFLLTLICLNIAQQNRVQQLLEATGGRGMTTDAITTLSSEALRHKDGATWFFPEWGFFMPFVFLTGNQVPYETELSERTLNKHPLSGLEARVAFWDVGDMHKYRSILENNGFSLIQLHQMDRRDGSPAFFFLSGHRSQDSTINHELLKNNNFDSIIGWELSPGSVYDPNEKTITVTASNPAVQSTTIEAGRKYRNEVVARCGSKGSIGRLQINWYNSTDNFISANISTFDCKAKSTNYEMTVVAPLEATKAVVYTSGHNNLPIIYISNSLLQ